MTDLKNVLKATEEFTKPVYYLGLTELVLKRTTDGAWKIEPKRQERKTYGESQIQCVWLDYPGLKGFGFKVKVPRSLDPDTNVRNIKLTQVPGKYEVREVWEPSKRTKVPEITYYPEVFVDTGKDFVERKKLFYKAVKELEQLVVCLLVRHCTHQDIGDDDDDDDGEYKKVLPRGDFKRRSR